jgi:hypothetical protein
MVVAIGIRNCACGEVSNKIGVNPPMVVSDVTKTARSRIRLALTIASA